MLFSVIYSVSVPSSEDVMVYAPPHLDLWDQTEGDEQYEYSYLEGPWITGAHRKWAAILNRMQFDEFVRHCGLTAEDVRTLGSIGAPGLGMGLSPAISFEAHDDVEAIRLAYVTPIPETRRRGCGACDWERIREAILSVYGQRF